VLGAGRPRVTPLMGFRADETTRAALVSWAEGQPDDPTLSEAVRRLVEIGLSVNTRPKQASRARADQANKMGGDQLDRLADQSASSSEQASRKIDLL
jgi:hypothetical protein